MRIDYAEIQPRLRDNIRALARDLFPGGSMDGADYCPLNHVRGDRKAGSMRITVAGSAAGRWVDFVDADYLKGGPLNLVAYALSGRPQIDAQNAADVNEYCAAFLGLRTDDAPYQRPATAQPEHRGQSAQARTDREHQQQRQQRKAHAFEVWRSAVTNDRFPIYSYLRGRKIAKVFDLKYPNDDCPFRFHKNLWCREVGRGLPAMVSKIGRAGTFVGIHRIYLHQGPLEWEKAALRNPKLTLGAYGGGCVEVWRGRQSLDVPLIDARAHEIPIICEGIEDAALIASVDPDRRVLAAVSLTNIGEVWLPETIRTVMVAADRDDNMAARRALSNAVEKLRSRGLTVKLRFPPGGAKDYNAYVQDNVQDKAQGARQERQAVG